MSAEVAVITTCKNCVSDDPVWKVWQVHTEVFSGASIHHPIIRYMHPENIFHVPERGVPRVAHSAILLIFKPIFRIPPGFFFSIPIPPLNFHV